MKTAQWSRKPSAYKKKSIMWLVRNGDLWEILYIIHIINGPRAIDMIIIRVNKESNIINGHNLI